MDGAGTSRAIVGTYEQVDHVAVLNRPELVAVVVDIESDREPEIPGVGVTVVVGPADVVKIAHYVAVNANEVAERDRGARRPRIP